MFSSFSVVLAEAATEAATEATKKGNTGGFGVMGIVLYLAFFIALMYFLLIRPQKKQNRKQEEVMNSIEPGDNIMTSSGFYGTILDVVDDTTVIVEFGNNKNCRIPMHKRAIAEVEKAGTAEIKDDEQSDK
ncbi:MAG: preprotein translocase subunit YajC [Eubacterium sp.]|nr:preprotein translocase subunit YajC [Eubacterium sp.]